MAPMATLLREWKLGRSSQCSRPGTPVALESTSTGMVELGKARLMDRSLYCLTSCLWLHRESTESEMRSMAWAMLMCRTPSASDR